MHYSNIKMTITDMLLPLITQSNYRRTLCCAEPGPYSHCTLHGLRERRRKASVPHLIDDKNIFRSVLFQCVLECSGEEVGRLEPRKAQLSQLRFGQQAMGFPLKLLVLAAAIRIAAMPQVTGFVPNESRSKRRNKKKTFCSIVWSTCICLHCIFLHTFYHNENK